MSILDGGFSAPSQPSRSRPHGNLRALRIAVVVLFAILGLQLLRMQVLRGEEFRARAEENYVRIASILPPRGLIYDRDGVPLVQNTGVYQVSITPDLLPSLPEGREKRYQIYLALEEITGMSALSMQGEVNEAEELGRGYIEITFDQVLTKEQALKIEEQSVALPGVRLVVTAGRKYIEGTNLAHILGFVGKQQAEDGTFYLDQGYQFNELVGRSGVEATYETALRGKPGLSSNEEDAFGTVISALKTRDPVPGGNLQLAIDLDLQNFVAEQLEANLKEAKVAAAVVMNAKTGEVYALVSYPGYDNNLFSDTEKFATEYPRLAADPRKPFLNWALSSEAPGSTFKLLTAAAALQEGNITPQTGRNVDSTRLEIKGENGVIYYLLDWNAHGWVDLYSGIAKSSNHFFYQASCGVPHEGKPGLGNTYDVEKQALILADYAKDFGFGGPTGIDIGGESNGIIPTPLWKREVHSGPDFFPSDQEWYYADTCFMGIGQGDVKATPMQIARMTAAIANGGTLVTPHVGKAVLDTTGKVTSQITPSTTKVPVNAQHLADIREGMRQSVQDIAGAGVLANRPGYNIAGKTGTAEFGGIDPTTGKQYQHAWFTGFAPFDDPTFVVTVYFDLGIGGEKAAPVAGNILQFAMDNVTP